MRRLLPLLLLACTSCAILNRLERNAPGDIDLNQPPPKSAPRGQLETPRDPGDNVVLISIGPRASLGLGFPAYGDPRFGYNAGAQASVELGYLDKSFAPALFDPPYPDRGLGVAFGWTPTLEGDQPARFSTELIVRRKRLALALGYVWELDGSAQGPQATLSLGPLYLRGNYLNGRSSSLQVGLALELIYSIVWSR